MPDTNPTSIPDSGPTVPLSTAEQKVAATAQDREAALNRIEFGLMATLLPVLNERAPLSTLRYYMREAIQLVATSPDLPTIAPVDFR